MNRIDKIILIILLVLTACISAHGFYTYSDFYHDDSLISLRYCRNFIDGRGLVWNEGERVEGYSNFLFMMFVSALGFLGMDLIYASQVIGILSFIAINVILFIYLRRRGETRRNYSFLIPIIITITSYPLIIWGFGGLEGDFFACLVLIGALAFIDAMEKDNWFLVLAGAFFALTAMARVDGPLFFAITLLFVLYFLAAGKIKKFFPAVSFIAAFALIYGIYFIWRWQYYGRLMPNTYYAKSGLGYIKFIGGLYYILDYILSPPYLFVLFVLAIIYALARRAWNWKLSYLAAMIFAYLIYIALQGGDHMPAFRLIVPLIPLQALFLFFAFESLLKRLSKRISLIICLCLTLLTSLQAVFPAQRVAYARELDSAAFVGTIVAKYIEAAWPAGSVIALNTAGSTPYFAHNNTYIDMLGLNDTTIARREIDKKVLSLQNIPGHEKGDGEYVLSRKPDYIIMGPAEGTSAQYPWFLSDLEISRSRSFRDNYMFRQVRIPVDYIDDYDKYYATKSGQLVFSYYERIMD